MDPSPILKPSLIDRLTDPGSGGTADRRGYTMEQVIAAVQRDLEGLLNTRAARIDRAEDYPEVCKSIIAFGLPDLGSLAAVTTSQQEEIGRVLESAVKRFEPRLRNVHATLLKAADPKERSVRFRIDATLNADPAPDVSFETILELGTGQYSVQQADS